jgi:type II secretory pathway pseudopilin PulG
MDAQEQRDLEQKIDNNPELEEKLLDIKAALTPLDCLDSRGHRPGLARRACEAVAIWDADAAAARMAALDAISIDWNEGTDEGADQGVDLPEITSAIDAQTSKSQTNKTTLPADNAIDAVSQAIQTAESISAADNSEPTPTVAVMGSADAPIFRDSSWSMREMLVAVAALGILASLLFPALSYSRYNSRLLSCQDNLRQVGMAFMNYSSINDGNFVAIPAGGKLASSGCYGPILKDAGLLESDSLLACAGLGSDTSPVAIPTVAQIESSDDDQQIQHYRQSMGGHYGHSMGYRNDNGYQAHQNSGNSQVVLLADQPSSRLDRQSLNHNGNGQNCLFGDGRVAFVSGPAYGGDNLFVNDYGVVGPGASAIDNVIAPSHLSPAVGLLH